jgi:molybdopterin molybdotransferase
MLTVDEALDAVLKRVSPLAARATTLDRAQDCLLAEDVAADIDLPPFDKSMVDGYAVRTADLADRVHQLRVVEEVTAGRVPSLPLGAGEAAHIMTGAPLPAGADAVVMHEKTRREGDVVEILERDVSAGRNCLERGREARRGAVVLEAGVRLTPVRLGLLASVGRTRVMVVPRPSVVVVPTGDELVEPDQVPGPGQIRNSNATMIAAMVRAAGAGVRVHPAVGDEPGALARALAAALEDDVLVITGGVSAGTHDLVPGVLDELGVARVFHKVRVRPGKPVWFGVRPGAGDPGPPKLVFGLPGNPISGLVAFLLFVRPALVRLAGGAEPDDRTFEARLARPFVQKGDRPTYHPAVLKRRTRGKPGVEPLEWAGSSDLSTVARAEGFVCFPPGEQTYRTGEIVRFLPLG